MIASTLASLAPLHSVWSQPKKQRAAVVIGVDKAGDLPVLRAAASGARQVETLLHKDGYDVTSLVDDTETVTVDKVFSAVDFYIRKSTIDQLVVYFAGHGCAAEYVEYWLLSEATHNLNQAVSLRESVELARRYSGIPNVIFISDACRSTPASLGLAGIKGGVIFPTASSVRATDVDQFLATLVGEPSFEVPVSDSTRNYAGIYTSTLISAFSETNAEFASKVDGVDVVPNKRLKRYLEREVPLRAQKVNIQLNQRPDAIVTSDDDIYIARAAKTVSARPNDATPTVKHLAAASLDQVGLRGLVQRPLVTDVNRDKYVSSARVLDAKTGFSESESLVASEIKAFESFVESNAGQLRSTGFYVSGQSIEAAYAIVEGSAHPFERISEHAITVDEPPGRAVSALIQFSDGSSTMMASLYGYMGNIVVAKNGVINVSYLPRHGGYDRNRLDQLHAAVATAARFGVFRIERGEGKKASGEELAGAIRMMKGIDPTLGLYAAYAYSDAGIQRQVESVRRFMRGDLQVDLFDTAMLSGAFARREATWWSTAPLCPMLAQGWALLRVNNVELIKDVAACRKYLRPSLWTTFEPKGTELLLDAMRQGRLKA
ncbi:caspase family protein [Ralstonia pseudosolanacearum]